MSCDRASGDAAGSSGWEGGGGRIGGDPVCCRTRGKRRSTAVPVGSYVLKKARLRRL